MPLAFPCGARVAGVLLQSGPTRTTSVLRASAPCFIKSLQLRPARILYSRFVDDSAAIAGHVLRLAQ
jgi:hypothetical protein